MITHVFLSLWFADSLFRILSAACTISQTYVSLRFSSFNSLSFSSCLSYILFPFLPLLSLLHSFLPFSFFLSSFFLSSDWLQCTFPYSSLGWGLEEGATDLILVHNYSEIIAIWEPNLKWSRLL